MHRHTNREHKHFSRLLESVKIKETFWRFFCTKITFLQTIKTLNRCLTHKINSASCHFLVYFVHVEKMMTQAHSSSSSLENKRTCKMFVHRSGHKYPRAADETYLRKVFLKRMVKYIYIRGKEPLQDGTVRLLRYYNETHQFYFCNQQVTCKNVE